MLHVEKFALPSPQQVDLVIDGMRNAFKSWSKSDSHLIEIDIDGYDLSTSEGYIDDDVVPFQNAVDVIMSKELDTVARVECEQVYKLGKNDKRLLTMLTSMGTSDRKALRQLNIILKIMAPEYWWRQFDTYKVGTTANSTSQMHTLLHREFNTFDFSNDYVGLEESTFCTMEGIIDKINSLRDAYYNAESKQEKEIIWFQILELIPQSYNYTRTVSINYEVALTIIGQRLFHKLPEWKTLIVFLLGVPLILDLAKSAGFIQVHADEVFGFDSENKEWKFLCKLDDITRKI